MLGLRSPARQRRVPLQRKEKRQIAKGGSPPCRIPKGDALDPCQDKALPVVLVVALAQCQPTFFICVTSFARWYRRRREGRLTVATGALLTPAQVLPNLQPACNQPQACHQVN